MRKLIGLFARTTPALSRSRRLLETAHGVRRYPFQMLSQFSTSSKASGVPTNSFDAPISQKETLIEKMSFRELDEHYTDMSLSDGFTADLAMYKMLLSKGHQTYYRPYSGFGGEKISEGEFNTYLYKYLSGIRKNSIEPDLQLYVHFITLFAFCRNFAEAEKLFKECSKHLGPDIRLYNCLLNVYFRLGEIKRVHQVIHDMINDNNVQPNFQTVDVLKKIRKTIKVSEKVKPIVDSWRDSKYAVLRRQLEKYGESQQLQKFDQTIKDFLDGNGHMNKKIFNTIVKTYAEADDVKKVQEYVDKWSFALNFESYHALIDMYGRQYDVEKLEQIFREIKKKKFLRDAHFARPTYIKLIKAFANAKDRDRVDKYVNMMKSTQTQLGKRYNNTWTPSLATYTTFVSAYGKVMNFEAVERTLEEMQQNKVQVDGAFHNAVLGFYTTSQNRRIVEQYLNYIETYGFKKDAYTYNLLIRFYFRLGVNKRNGSHYLLLAKLWFDDMKSSGIMPNAKTYRRIVEVYAHLESHSWKMSEVSVSENYYHEHEDQFPMISGILEEIESFNFNPTIYDYRQRIHIYGILRMFDRVVDLVEDMKAQGFEPDITMYNSLMSVFSTNGKMDQVKSYLVEMQSERNIVPNVITYCILIEMYAASSHWDEVELYIHDLKERNITVNSRLAKALCKARNESKDIKLLVDDLSNTQSALKKMLDNENNQGESIARMQMERQDEMSKGKRDNLTEFF